MYRIPKPLQLQRHIMTFGSIVRIRQQIIFPLLLLFSASCTTEATSTAQSPRMPPTQKPYVINNIKYYPIATSAGYVDTGIASWYGNDFHGRPTSNGERYDMYGPTAAHKILPMNTMVHVRNLDNGRESVVRINDRGPFVRGRILDVSYGVAEKLGMLRHGTARVKITALAPYADGGYLGRPNFEEGEFFVQIGSFTHQANARRLQKRFADAGHTAVIRRFSLNSNTYYRVQIYTGTHLKTAKKAEKALLQKGYQGAFIIAR